MKVSLNWVNELSGVKLKTAELVSKIDSRLGAVESVEDIGERYKGIVIAKVVSCQTHPNADKLNVCLIDDKGTVKSVKRDSKGLVQVVCGAPNVREGMLVAWVPPGATVPATFDKDPFVLEAKELRGVISYGMLASAKELGLGDSHEGLLELDGAAKPGADFAKTYELDDIVIDIENKMFTHRPDCFGQLGVAREVAGITHKKFVSPGWYRADAKVPAGRHQLKLTVKNEVPKLVPRFSAVVISGIQVGPSPVWLQAGLAKLGVKPINVVVDITNYVMLLTAQPLHAYDYDKVGTGVLGVRQSRSGEQLELLGGKSIKLRAGAVVITDGKKPIGLGGIMGGATTEVSSETKNIILECASFDMNQTRKISMEYGLFTEAATRFTKNQSPAQNMAVLARASEILHQLSGGTVGSVLDEKSALAPASKVKVDASFINSRLGTDISATEIKRLLENTEFQVAESSNKLTVTAPFWRTDIEIAEDIVEEVGRLYGYENLPLSLPRKDISAPADNPALAMKSRIRDILVGAGANEVLTYSFVPESLMTKTGQDPKLAYKLINALSPELQYYRLSLAPSLLEKVTPNIKQGFSEFALFEIGKSHKKGSLDDAKLPSELERVALVTASQKSTTGAAYYSAKKYCDFLLDELGIYGLEYIPVVASDQFTLTPYYQPGRSAVIEVGGVQIGRIGEYKPSVRQELKLPQFCAGFELHLDSLLELAGNKIYQPVNRFPATAQDICLRTVTGLPYQAVAEFIRSELNKLAAPHGYSAKLDPVDTFQKEGDNKHKQTTWHISLSHPERTLTTEETNQLLDKLAQAAKSNLKAERVV